MEEEEEKEEEEEEEEEGEEEEEVWCGVNPLIALILIRVSLQRADRMHI